MTTKIFKSMNLIRRGSRTNLNLFRYAAMVIMLLTLGAGNAWGDSHSTHTATLNVYKGTGSGTVYASTSGSATSGSASASFDCGGSESGPHTGKLYAYANPADGYTFKGWTTSSSSSSGANSANPMGVDFDVTDGSSTQTYYAHFVEKAKVNITFIAPSNGTYTIKVDGGSVETVSSANVVKNNVESVTLTATPASGYAFAGWYKLNSAGEFVEDLSLASPYDASFTASETIKMGARFVPTTLGKFILKGSDTQYYGLKMATIAAGGSGTIVPVADETLVDGSDLMPFDYGTYNIKAGATLLVPYSSANTVQTAPQIIKTAVTLSAYKTLVFTDGVNVECDGTICVGGQIMAGSGGSMSSYVSGPCGMINMANGGHIELNSGAKLYCWGFIKGQDMDQGNNTVGVGTITANSGAEVWENLGIGDWRGGTATSNIKNTRFFPFQSYFIQNIEVPLTIEYGATEKNYIALNATGGPYNTSATTIGSSKALFLLKDANSTFRKWYDPTTDLTCFELSGTSQIDALAIKISALGLNIDVNSADFDLPINSSMHIILTNSSVTLSKPMVLQPGAVIEVKNDANITLSSNAYLYDKDNWGAYAGPSYYFHSYPNLTSHKNRGDGKSNALLDDAKVIVDGTVSVTGKLYSTAAGANVMGNGGGKIVFSTGLPTATTIPAFTSNGDAVSGGVAVNSANLCNEDESYTKAIASTTFHNVNGRWFTAAAKDEKANHTYDFTYISSGAVSGTGGTNSTTEAVYAPDKTGLTAGMKWCNVTQDATCTSIYNATQSLNEMDAANIRYTYLSSSWIQLLKISEGLYNGSNDNLYALESNCTLTSLGSVDGDCLYTLNEGGVDVKKAYVNGSLVALAKNTEDEAWHNTAVADEYYVCFSGCTWHPATKYAGEEKAYTVEGGIYIWYGGDWKLVEREAPYFFDYNDQNVKRYYEYENGAWVLASPRVRVQDAIETRDFYFLPEAITVASGKKNTTITILKDISGINTRMTYTAKNTTCTLDLNGHTVSGAAPFGDDNNRGLLIINASGTIFTITDSTTNKEGRLENICNQNKVTYTVHLMAGTLNLNAGTIHVENNGVYNNSNYASLGARAIQQAANTTLNISGGRIESFAGRNAYGILQDANATTTTTLTMTGGDIYVEAPAYAYGVSAKNVFNFSNGTITVRLNTSTVNSNTSDTGADRINHRYGYGIMMTGAANATASSNIFSTLNMTGGKVYSYNDNIKTTTQLHTYGIYFNGGSTNVAVGGSAAVDGTYSQKWSAKGTISNAEIYVENTGRTAYGVFVVGSYNSKDNKSHVVKISNTKITTYASYDAIGVYANASIGTTSTKDTRNLAAKYHGDIELNNCEVKAETTSSVNAYAVQGVSTSNTIYADQTEYDTSSKTDIAQTRFTGEYATASKITINGGTYSAKSASYNAFAIHTSVRSITTYGTDTKVYANKTPGGHKKDSVILTINGGTFNATSGSYQAYGIHSGGETTIDDATFNVVAGSYYAYGLYVPSGKLTATNVQVNDTAKGRVKSSDNNAYAYGVQAHCGIPSGNTAQTGFAYAGEVELNNCTINAIATTYQNARGIFVNATSKLHNWAQFKADSLSNKWSKDTYNQYSQVFPCTQQGKDNVWVGIAAKATVNGGKITVLTHTTTAYGAFVSRAVAYSYTKPNTILEEYPAQLELNDVEFDVQTEGTTTAEGVCSYGQTTITDGSFFVQPKSTTAYGIKVYSGKTTVNGEPEFTVKATRAAYGIMVGETPADKTGTTYNGEVEVNGGTFIVETTTDTLACGVRVFAGSRPITSTAAGNYAGNYASAGKATINAGVFNVTSKKTNAYGIDIRPAVSQSGASGYATATATPICEVNGGTFTATGTTDFTYGAYVSNGVTLKVTDGAFKGKLTAVAADKYAVGAYIAAGGILNATGGAFEAEAAKSGLTKAQKSYACGLYSPDGTATISASNAIFKGELKSTYLTNGNASTWTGGAYGFYARTTNPLSLTNCTITGNSAYQGGFGLRFANTPAEVRNCTVNVTTTKAYNYGLFVGGASCDVKLYDCSFTCTSGTTYAYGIYAANGATYAEDCEINAIVQRTGASSVDNSNLYGVLVATGKTATLKGCTITATGSGKYSNNGYGVYVDGTANLDNCDVSVSNINDGAYALFNTSNTTLLNVASGKYKASATTNAASTNGTAAKAKQTLNGGYYSHDANLSKYAVSPKKVITLRQTHTLYPDYKYTINEGGTVTWKNGTTTLKTEMYESGETPAYTGDTPTKAEDDEYTYSYSGWTPTIEAMANADQTYTATFNHTERKYSVNVSAGDHGSITPTSVSGIGCLTASGDITAIPPATGYSFAGWTLPTGVTAAAGYNANSNPIRIHATAAGKTITATWTCTSPTGLSIVSTGDKWDFCAGESMTLTVSGTNIAADATYLWKISKDGGSTYSNAPGTNNAATYTVSSMDAANGGKYTCTVTNGSCSTTSAGVDVKVWYLHINNGTSGAWQDIPFTNNAGTKTGTANVTLDADHAYGFKLWNELGESLGWYGLNSKTITSTESNITLNSTGANVSLTSGLAGTYVFTIDYTSATSPKISVTYPTANQPSGRKIWFDKSVIDGWGNNVYYRVGKTSHNSNQALSLVPGTDQFYEMTTNGYDGFEAWQIANNTSWSDGNSIYLVNGSGYEITKATNFQKYVVDASGITIVPTTSHNTENGCNYWNVSTSAGMLTHRVTISTPDAHGTVTVSYTNTSNVLSELTSGYADLAHRCILNITTTPNTGYRLASLKIGEDDFSGNPLILTADVTITATFEVSETGFYADIVDVDNAAKTLTLNVTGWASNGWPYNVNGTSYEKTARETDRTLIISYGDRTPGDEFPITVRKKTGEGELVSMHTYIIPQEVKSDLPITTNQTKNLYVKGAELTINADLEAKNIYVAPGAKLTISSGKTLTADTIFLRTTADEVAELLNNGTIAAKTKVVYTRIIKDKNFHLFGLPLSCPIASVRLSNSDALQYSTGWLLRSYNGERRAAEGADDKNWVTLAEDGTIAGGAGYELYSASNYYREFYFPVNLASLTDQVAVTYHSGAAGEKHAGWNAITSPLTQTYNNTKEPENLSVSWYMGGYYMQEIPSTIPPATVFAFQASEGQSYLSFKATRLTALMPRRRAAAEEEKQIQWIELDVADVNGIGDQTSVYSHPTRYDETYQTGIDVAKQSLIASRALIYSSHAYGDMAFAGVSDEKLKQGVALTVYSPRDQELTFSMRENDWLNRMAYVWLYDAETGATIDMMDSEYTAAVTEGTTSDRFWLRGAFKSPQIATGIDETESDIRISDANGNIAISGVADGTPVLVFDAVGHMLYYGKANGTEIEIPAPSAGVYMLRVGNQTAKMVINK